MATPSFGNKRPVVVDVQRLPIAQIKRVLCAWRDCSASCPVVELPPGWACLMVFWQARPTATLDVLDPGIHWHRDAVLCPEHVAALEALLRSLPDMRLLTGTSGRA